MRYLCLAYREETTTEAPTTDGDAASGSNLVADREGPRWGGPDGALAPPHPVQDAVTVRVRNGKVSVTDGPFAETRERLGGCFLIEARDLNDAIRVAAKMPPARLGSIEVRPIAELGAG